MGSPKKKLVRPTMAKQEQALRLAQQSKQAGRQFKQEEGFRRSNKAELKDVLLLAKQNPQAPLHLCHQVYFAGGASGLGSSSGSSGSRTSLTNTLDVLDSAMRQPATAITPSTLANQSRTSA